jgi:hypothetical protein
MNIARFALAALCLAAVGCSRDELICDEKSPGVAYARSLSKERLARLYYDMEAYSNRDETPLNGWSVGDKRLEIPSAFADLAVARIRPRDGNIMVRGCLDHYIYLHFEGIGDFKNFDEKRRVILSWGEHPPSTGEQVLWEEDVQQ